METLYSNIFVSRLDRVTVYNKINLLQMLLRFDYNRPIPFLNQTPIVSQVLKQDLVVKKVVMFKIFVSTVNSKSSVKYKEVNA